MKELAKDADLSSAVVLMSRFLTRLSALPAFKEAGLGVAEWSALSVLAGEDDLSNKQLARLLGVTGQRVAQIVDGLKGAHFVTVTHSVEDTRKNVIKVTEKGISQLRELDGTLKSALTDKLGNDRSVVAVERNLKRMMRLFKDTQKES